MINIEEQTDSLDGKNFNRQLNILLTDLLLLAGSWFVIMGFEWLTLSLAGYSDKQAGRFVENMEPVTFLVWALMWISLAPMGFVNPQGNHIQATHNPLSPERLQGGGTRFIVYQTGYGLKYLWERLQGPELAIENEVAFEGDLTTVSIQKISLEMKLSFLYRVYLPNLSSYLQNRTEENGLLGIINQLKAASNQHIEEAAAGKDDTEEVRKDQTSIINAMLKKIRPNARRFGINILQANFIKCDYSADTQKELNKVLEARSVNEIADKMGLEDKGRALELAAVIAGKPGAKVGRTILELVMKPEVAEAVKEVGPAAVAVLATTITKEKKDKA